MDRFALDVFSEAASFSSWNNARLLLFAYHYRMPSKSILLAAKLACFVFVEALLLFPQLSTELFAHCVLSKASFHLLVSVSIYALFDQFLVRASTPYPPCTLYTHLIGSLFCLQLLLLVRFMLLCVFLRKCFAMLANCGLRSSPHSMSKLSISFMRLSSG